MGQYDRGCLTGVTLLSPVGIDALRHGLRQRTGKRPRRSKSKGPLHGRPFHCCACFM